MFHSCYYYLLSNCLRNIDSAKCNPVDKNNLSDLAEMRHAFQKSIYASRFIPKGEIVTFDSLKFLKPEAGLSASRWRTVVGRKSSRDIEMGEVFLDGFVE